MQWFWVGLGGALGSMLRFFLQGVVQSSLVTQFPVGTLAVNLLGSAAIGVVAGMTEILPAQPNLRVFLMAGLLGGFTTFSAFSLDNLNLARSGQMRTLMLNVVLSNALGLALAILGFYLARALMRALGHEI